MSVGPDPSLGLQFIAVESFQNSMILQRISKDYKVQGVVVGSVGRMRVRVYFLSSFETL